MINKRGRSETMSTNLSDKHVIMPIPSYHICSCHLVFLFSYHGFLICLLPFTTSSSWVCLCLFSGLKYHWFQNMIQIGPDMQVYWPYHASTYLQSYPNPYHNITQSSTTYSHTWTQINPQVPFIYQSCHTVIELDPETYCFEQHFDCRMDMEHAYNWCFGGRDLEFLPRNGSFSSHNSHAWWCKSWSHLGKNTPAYPTCYSVLKRIDLHTCIDDPHRHIWNKSTGQR